MSHLVQRSRDANFDEYFVVCDGCRTSAKSTKWANAAAASPTGWHARAEKYTSRTSIHRDYCPACWAKILKEESNVLRKDQ